MGYNQLGHMFEARGLARLASADDRMVVGGPQYYTTTRDEGSALPCLTANLAAENEVVREGSPYGPLSHSQLTDTRYPIGRVPAGMGYSDVKPPHSIR